MLVTTVNPVVMTIGYVNLLKSFLIIATWLEASSLYLTYSEQIGIKRGIG